MESSGSRSDTIRSSPSFSQRFVFLPFFGKTGRGGYSQPLSQNTLKGAAPTCSFGVLRYLGLPRLSTKSLEDELGLLLAVKIVPVVDIRGRQLLGKSPVPT